MLLLNNGLTSSPETPKGVLAFSSFLTFGTGGVDRYYSVPPIPGRKLSMPFGRNGQTRRLRSLDGGMDKDSRYLAIVRRAT